MDELSAPVMSQATLRRVGAVLGRVPQGLYLMTAAAGRRQRAVLVSWVQQAAFDPPMVVVALRKGRDIMPLIHESRAFALNQVAADDRVLVRKFSRNVEDEDPLAAIETVRKATGAPVLPQSLSYMDCELVRHVDIEADHDLYVGLIHDAEALRDGDVPVHLRENGLAY